MFYLFIYFLIYLFYFCNLDEKNRLRKKDPKNLHDPKLLSGSVHFKRLMYPVKTCQRGSRFLRTGLFVWTVTELARARRCIRRRFERAEACRAVSLGLMRLLSLAPHLSKADPFITGDSQTCSSRPESGLINIFLNTFPPSAHLYVTTVKRVLI